MHKQQQNSDLLLGVFFFATLILILMLLPGCGVKWATNKVLTNRDAIEKVGAVYDALTPRDTTEKLVFIQGDTITTTQTDTVRVTDTHTNTDTIRITKTVQVSRIDTVLKQLPPDNRLLSRMTDTAAHYKRLFAEVGGKLSESNKAAKTAENRLIWMAGVLLLAGVVIGVLIRLKLKP